MIAPLLQKFYAGETSPAEEQDLLRLLEATDDPRYEPDRQTLRSLSPEMPDFAEMARKATKTQRLNLWRKLSIAASVAIILIAANGLHQRQPVEPTMTVDEANQQATMALMALSDGLNKGYYEILKLQDL